MGIVVPRANVPFAGVTAIDTSTACPTFSVADPAIVPDVAVMVAVPTPSPLANPPDPTPATGDDELHVTLLVTFCVLPSLNVPVAVNCWFVPFAIVALPGFTPIDTNTGAVTVKAAEPATEPEVAVIATDP
jgi:hypothetical protein